MTNFIDDKEKMLDFAKLSKEEFLKSYSYLSEKEYDETLQVYTKQKTAVMVEFIDDTNNWNWFDVRVNTTPEKAIIDYLENHGLIEENEKVTFTTEMTEDGYEAVYADKDDVRAFIINLN